LTLEESLNLPHGGNLKNSHVRILLCVVLFLSFHSETSICAEEEPLPKISVVYPRPGAKIGASDSTFIFGSVTPESQLAINGHKVRVHPNGAFLAFLPLAPGDFIFELIAENRSGQSSKKLSVKVPEGISPIPEDSFCIARGSVRPRENLILSSGDVLETSFRGTPGCLASFSIEGLVADVPMVEAYLRIPFYEKTDPWGENKPGLSWTKGFYSGSYIVRDDDKIERAKVSFRLMKKVGDDSVYVAETSPGQVTIREDSIPQVVEFVGSTVVARSGPKLGYTLLYQPPGIRAVATGKRGEWVRLGLAYGENAWVHQDSIRYMPLGTPVPKSVVTTIRTERLDNSTRVVLLLSRWPGRFGKLPFRVEQQIDPPALFLTVYGLISNTDWIRYDSEDELIREITWEQPKEDVYQLKISLSQSQQWGYDAFYEEDNLVLEVNHQPEIKRGLEGLRICLDPGHSPDPGAVGPTGLEEKVVNLKIATKLKKILERNGAEVVMTREGTDGLTIYERPKVAIQKRCDLLISIHNNALPDGVNPFYNNGTSTYYYHPQALALAREIHSELLKRLEIADFGIYYGNLALTRPSQLPSVLVECAFMMIPEQEELLKTEKFQKKCAEGIYRGIRRFVEKTYK
jgi:N-acetylmuramoyl-L-alanine amidase